MKYIALFSFLLLSQFSSQVYAGPYEIERSVVRSITSLDKNRTYDLFIKIPRTYSSNLDQHYPIIILNDGGYAFPLVSSITRQMSGAGKIDEPIIVGISYDKNQDWKISRTRDYTPTNSLDEEQRHSDEARKHSGGADKYLEFISNELLPFLHSNYRINSEKEIYAGHSFGGLFGGFMIKNKPKTFDYYILSDSSFWYDTETIFDQQGLKELRFKDIEINALLMASQPEREKAKMANLTNRFSTLLRALFSIESDIKVEIADGEIHETVFPIAVSRGLLNFLTKTR